MNSGVLGLFVAVIMLIAAGCSSTDEPSALEPGAVRVQVLTTGAKPDADGYSVIIGTTPARPIAANGEVMVADIPAGVYNVELVGLASNCHLQNPSPHTVTVPAGSEAHVAWTVNCPQIAHVNITVSTEGAVPDAAGYFLGFDEPGGVSGQFVAVPVNGSIVADLAWSDYFVTATSVPSRCWSKRPNPAQVTVAADEVSLAFSFTCAAARQFAFVLGTGNASEIAIGSNDGTAYTQVTSNAVADSNPAWSRDGQRLAFTSTRDGNDDIYVMNANGANVVRLTTNAAADYQPSWSPDGTHIAFVSNRDGVAQLYVMAADGSGQTRIAASTLGELEPAWSPTDNRIAFSRWVEVGMDWFVSSIFLINADGTGLTPVTSSATADEAPVWSPAGDQIAFTRFEEAVPPAGGIGYLVHLLNLGDLGEHALATVSSGERPSSLSWSPEGRIAFAREEECAVAVCTLPVAVSPDGTGLNWLLLDAAGDAPSQTGFVRNGAGAAARAISSNYSEPEWRP